MSKNLPWNGHKILHLFTLIVVRRVHNIVHNMEKLFPYHICNLRQNFNDTGLPTFGAGLPGMRAVVIIISTSLACLANRAISASINSLEISLAYPPVPSPDSCQKIE